MIIFTLFDDDDPDSLSLFGCRKQTFTDARVLPPKTHREKTVPRENHGPSPDLVHPSMVSPTYLSPIHTLLVPYRTM